MTVVGRRSGRWRGAAALVVAALAVSAVSCASSRVFQHGNQAAMRGDWDLAVTFYERAVKGSPNRADYKMALDRARLSAAQHHFEQARGYEKQDQLDLALLEYRRVVEFHPGSQEARAKIQSVEQAIRSRIEAARPKPAVELMRQKARQAMDEPALNPASREPIEIRMPNRQIQEVLDFLGTASGINIAYDKDFPKTTVVSVNVAGVTLEEALDQILTVNQAYYKVINPRSIIIIADSQAKRTAYDEQAVQTFYLSSAEAADIEQLLTKVVAAQQAGVRPTFAANKAANSITVRATVPMLKMIERVIAMNDKPRAEISIDVELLEVNRSNARKHGLDLSSWTLGLAFSPESRPSEKSAAFNLNTVSTGVSTLDFYATVPSATVAFLESDSATKVIAKPNLRGSEGEKLSLKLGEELPVPSTTFYSAYGGTGAVATNPMTSFTYKNVGVNLDIEPRVTYDGEIIMKLTLEVSSQSSDRNVAGQNLPAFATRKVETVLRLRDGESNLLAGLLREDERTSLRGFPGATRAPILKQLFSANDNQVAQTDIVMLLTPHIVRPHALTERDFTPLFVGTQQNLGLAGPPPLIQPAGTAAQAQAQPPGQMAAAPAPPSGGPAPSPGPLQAQPRTGAAQPAPSGQLPPAVSTPGMVPAPPSAGLPPVPAAAPVQAEPAPAAAPEPEPAPPEPAAAEPAAAQPPADNLRVVLTPPAVPATVAGQAITVPISLFGASRVSTVTLSLRFDPKVLRVRLVQQGTFLAAQGGQVTVAQQTDADAGRLDVTLARTSDTTGVSGDGVLAIVVFDAVGAGTSSLGLGGVITGPGGLPIPAQFGQASVTVR
ncbi:MAG TPA: secretin N-terminal domain-containing protein [Vicinamibacterales bacterium]|nr:secretin N-terminal domain-containing protein [Vicinamibacterales bacterium]